MIRLICSVVLLINIASSSSILSTTAHDRPGRSWQLLEKFTQESIVDLVQKSEAKYGSILNSNGISSECQKSLQEFGQGLKRLELNAVKMLDSWGKIPSGILAGSLSAIGSFGECLELKSSQYCLMFTKPPVDPPGKMEGIFRPYPDQRFNLTSETFKSVTRFGHFFHYMNSTTGLCLPDQCSPKEIRRIAQNISSSHGLDLEIDVDLCQSRSQANPIRPREIVALSVVLAVLVANILGCFAGKSSPLRHFNFIQNCRNLVKTRTREKAYPYLDGIKALNMAFMMIVHVFFGLLWTTYENVYAITGMSREPLIIFGLLGPFTIDTFFLITGLEMASFFFSHSHSNPSQPDKAATAAAGRGENVSANVKSIPYHYYLVLRWLRFAPCIAWTLCLYVLTFNNHVRDWIGGPFWHFYQAAGSIPETCTKMAVPHLFLIGHYFYTPKDWNVCIMADWYLESDYVYAILFLVVLVPLRLRHKTIAMVNCLMMIVFGCVLLGLVVHLFDVQSSWLPTNFQGIEFVKYLMYIHTRPWGHLSPFFVGVLLGMIIDKSKAKLNWLAVTLMWFLWAVGLAAIVSYEMIVNFNLYPISYSLSLAYGMFSKLIWALLVAWFIYACQHQHVFQVIPRFLSSSLFNKLSRLNLSALFMNLYLMRIQNGTFQSTSYLTLYSLVLDNIVPILFYIYLVSFINCALIETPSLNLIKSFFHKSPKTLKEPIKCQNNNVPPKSQV